MLMQNRKAEEACPTDRLVHGVNLHDSGSDAGQFVVGNLYDWTSQTNGTNARRQPYHYAMGQRHERTSDALPGAVMTSEDASEQNQRGFYRRWAEIMDPESWADLK